MYFTLRIDTDNNLTVDKHDKIGLELDYLHKSVNGYIEVARCYGAYRDIFKNVIIVLDEEGLLKPDWKMNRIASYLYGNLIVGDVVLTTQYNPDPYAEPDCYCFDEPSFNKIYAIVKSMKEKIKR